VTAFLLRCLFFLEAKYELNLVAQHVPGMENTVPDAISRIKLDILFRYAHRSVGRQWKWMQE